MKIVRNPVLKTSKKPMTAMIIISIFMLLISVMDFSLIFDKGNVFLNISVMGSWTSLLSILPLSWGICTVLLLKTKKMVFSKMPGYIMCAMVVLAFILYYIIAGQDNTVTNVLLFSLAILLVYPIIIATLTIEGRLYNRVFATIFSVILVVLCFAGAIAASVILKWISLSFFVPALIYIELTLAVFCYNLEKPVRSDQNKNMITH